MIGQTLDTVSSQIKFVQAHTVVCRNTRTLNQVIHLKIRTVVYLNTLWRCQVEIEAPIQTNNMFVNYKTSWNVSTFANLKSRILTCKTLIVGLINCDVSQQWPEIKVSIFNKKKDLLVVLVKSSECFFDLVGLQSSDDAFLAVTSSCSVDNDYLWFW